MKMKNTMMKMMNQQERNSKIRILTNGKISILKKIDQIHNIWIWMMKFKKNIMIISKDNFKEII